MYMTLLKESFFIQLLSLCLEFVVNINICKEDVVMKKKREEEEEEEEGKKERKKERKRRADERVEIKASRRGNPSSSCCERGVDRVGFVHPPCL